ncbi:hypothetical protein ACFU99_02775 [Streptomyces sp. NPDC057654]|uniref:hypothetical protein n=1 Tax=Streptomyces sp. NPDC057654 TaxID=3346196 RepID=UPI0036990CE1
MPYPTRPADTDRTALRAAPYEVRAARAADQSAVAHLIDDRIVDLRTRTPVELDVDRATVLANLGNHEHGRPLVWLLCDDSVIVGCAVVLPTTPEWGWSESQRAEPALFIPALFTHPKSGVRTGRLLAWALLDYAWHLPTQGDHVLWVRGVTFSEKVMCYARDKAGWDVADTVLRHGRHAHLLQCPAQQRPNLSALVNTPRII